MQNNHLKSNSVACDTESVNGNRLRHDQRLLARKAKAKGSYEGYFEAMLSLFLCLHYFVRVQGGWLPLGVPSLRHGHQVWQRTAGDNTLWYITLGVPKCENIQIYIHYQELHPYPIVCIGPGQAAAKERAEGLNISIKGKDWEKSVEKKKKIL